MLTSVEWNNSHVIEGNVADEVTKLKGKTGGDILLLAAQRSSKH